VAIFFSPVGDPRFFFICFISQKISVGDLYRFGNAFLLVSSGLLMVLKVLFFFRFLFFDLVKLPRSDLLGERAPEED